MIWVLDASVAVVWFLEDETHPHAERVLERLLDQPETFAVPELFAFETFAVLERLHPSPLEAFSQGIVPLLQGGIFRQPMTRRLARRAHRFTALGLTGYDACYAALAQDLKGLWLTLDKKAHGVIERSGLSCLLSQGLPESW